MISVGAILEIENGKNGVFIPCARIIEKLQQQEYDFFLGTIDDCTHSDCYRTF